jgi:2-dehydro-3-deoxygluconokinase
MPDIIGIGEPLVELAAEDRGRLEGVNRFRRGWGGDTFNCMVAATRMGASTGYVTRVGDDPFGRDFLVGCRDEGIESSSILVEPTGYTGLYLIALAEDRQHSFTYYRRGSAASRLGPHDLDEDYIASARILHTSGITQAISDSALAASEEATSMARRHGVLVSYDANVRPSLRPMSFIEALFTATVPRADIVFVSGDDISYLYGTADARDVATDLLARGPQVVVVKSGAEGCVVASADTGVRTHSPWSVEVVDPSGGGDAFAGAFLVEWGLRGASLSDAGRLANAVGALTVSRLGASRPIPSRAQVAEFMRSSSG